MRLCDNQIEVLKNKLRQLSSSATIYLFGSRTDDSKKGGDIDLLVLSKKLKKKDIRLLRVDFLKHFGEQKIDIILDDGTLQDAFVKHIFPKAVRL